MAGNRYAKAYPSEPIDVEELALQVARLPIQGEGIIGSRVGGGRHWLGDESRFRS